MSHVPKDLQAILWSKNIGALDTEADKTYIIHNVLSYGDIPALRWLLKTYSKRELGAVFMDAPKRIYQPAVFYFVKDIVLGLDKKKISAERYVKTPLADS